MSDHWQDWFGTRKWRVLTEADGIGSVVDKKTGDPISVRFREGRFAVDDPGSFVSPFGSRGRKGVLLQEVGADGTDVRGSMFAFGESVVKRAREQFHAVT